MDGKTVFLITLAIVASGCTQIPGFNDGNTGPQESTGLEGKGLEVTRFTVSDQQLSPSQTAIITLEGKNYHTTDVEIDSIDIYNTGDIEPADAQFQDFESACTGLQGSTVPKAQRGLSPEFSCQWRIQAPEAEEIGDFDSKSFNPRARVLYSSSLSNGKDPFSLQFIPGTEISQSSPVTKTYSNGEVTMTIEADNPVPVEGETTVSIQIDSASEGGLVSDVYEVRVQPGSIFDHSGVACSGDIREGTKSAGSNSVSFTLETPIQDSGNVGCRASIDDNRQVQRSVIISTDYKYQKTPNVHIEVVS